MAFATVLLYISDAWIRQRSFGQFSSFLSRCHNFLLWVTQKEKVPTKNFAHNDIVVYTTAIRFGSTPVFGRLNSIISYNGRTNERGPYMNSKQFSCKSLESVLFLFFSFSFFVNRFPFRNARRTHIKKFSI